MMDNAFSNDTLIETIAKDFRREGVLYNAIQQRLQCNGHVLNLSAQAFLLGKSVRILNSSQKTLILSTLLPKISLRNGKAWAY